MPLYNEVYMADGIIVNDVMENYPAALGLETPFILQGINNQTLT